MNYSSNNFVKSVERNLLEMKVKEVSKIEINQELTSSVIINDKKLINDFFATVRIYEHNSKCKYKETSLGITTDTLQYNSIKITGYSQEKNNTLQRKYFFCKDYKGNLEDFINKLN